MLDIPGMIATCLLVGVKSLLILIALGLVYIDRRHEPLREDSHH